MEITFKFPPPRLRVCPPTKKHSKQFNHIQSIDSIPYSLASIHSIATAPSSLCLCGGHTLSHSSSRINSIQCSTPSAPARSDGVCVGNSEPGPNQTPCRPRSGLRKRKLGNDHDAPNIMIRDQMRYQPSAKCRVDLAGGILRQDAHDWHWWLTLMQSS